MEIFLIKLLQFLLAISLLVLLHEGGHFFFAKLFGIRVEKFYLFFDPYFHLFEFKPKNSETAYGIGWLPLGGYCKIAGMIDESFDTEQMSKPAESWEFRSKPAWQRLLVMLGGVLVNFLLALFIYAMCLFTWGDNYVKTKDMTLGMKFSNEAKALGFQDNDILVGTDLGEFKKYGPDVFRDMARAKEAYVIRGGKQITVSLPGDLDLLEMFKSVPPFMAEFREASVDSVARGSLAQQMGLRKGDRIVALNGVKLSSYNDFMYEVGRISDVLAYAKTHADSLKALSVNLILVRNANGRACTINTHGVLKTSDNEQENLKFGFYPKQPNYKITHIDYGFFESFPAGVKYGCNVLGGYVGDMKYLFSAEGAKSLGGFGAIGNMFPAEWDWHMFWLMTAFLSIILAFMNILPIPALDGGHVLFLIYEMITRRKPSENFMIRAEYIGIGILMLLMLVANINDVLRWLHIM